MKLVRFGESGRERPGVMADDGKIFDVSLFGEDYCEEFFQADGISRLKSWITAASGDASDRGHALPQVEEGIRLGPPVCRPSKIVCIGLNFTDHAAESGMEIPPEPIVFLKAPSALAGPNDDLILPRNSDSTDWEVELAVVMAKKTRYVSKDSAMEHIAGYMLFNDYSEREYQFKRGGQWVKGKSADTFASVGPFLATPDVIKDHKNLRLWLKVNGSYKQDSNSSNMILDIPEIIALISQYMTLLPGDIVSTGTPAGVGYGRKPQEYLRPGDIVEYGIDGLGRSSQKVVAYDD